MKLILKYIKPVWFGVVLCITLLFGQAVCELSLPSMMGDIVNVGIQQGGITDGAPEAISEEGMEMLSYFMTDEEKECIMNAYIHILPESNEAKRYRDRYPLARDAGIYVRTAKDEPLELANEAYAASSYALMLFLQETAAEAGMEMAVGNDAEGYTDINIAELYQLLPAMEQMPAERFESKRSEAADGNVMITEQVGITFTKLFYDEIGIDMVEIQKAYILRVGLKMLAVALGSAAAAVLVNLVSSVLAAKIGRRLRRDLFEKVQNFSRAEMDQFSTASLITRTTNDVQQIQMLITMGLRMMCYSPIMGIGGVLMAVRRSVSLTWVIAAAILFMLGIIIVVMAIVMPKFKILQKLTDRLNLVSRESLSGMMVIRAFGNEKHEEERFEKANKDLSQTNLFTQKAMGVVMPLIMLVMNITTLVIIWVGGFQVEAVTLQIGDMLAFIQYGMQIIMSFLFIAMMFVFIPRAMVSANRIGEVLDTEITVQDRKATRTPDRIKGTITFKNVAFKYQGAEENVIENISFTAKPGQTTAFIGSTGSGKSTLINLIPRFYDPTEGEILLDGINIRDLTQKQLREAIGYVPQKALLFSGTIASNIQYGKETATEEEMAKSIEVAQAAGFVYQEDKGINMHISQGGTNVSGGQRQRLSIARAVVRNAPVYIFDDSFSALDFKTDSELRKALKQYTGDATMLIVAQRVSTIRNAEQIIVLDEGKIAGIGTHGELMKNCEEYRQIAESQLEKEESA